MAEDKHGVLDMLAEEDKMGKVMGDMMAGYMSDNWENGIADILMMHSGRHIEAACL